MCTFFYGVLMLQRKVTIILARFKIKLHLFSITLQIVNLVASPGYVFSGSVASAMRKREKLTLP